MKKITVWRVINDNKEAKLNHIEDGWSDSDKPQPIKKEFTNQTAWQNENWFREHKYLVDGKVQ